MQRSEDGKLDAFGYDYSNQMTAVSYGWNWNGSGWVNPSRALNYALDLAGNRNQATDSATGTVTYQHNNLNEYNYAPHPIYYDPFHSIGAYKGIGYSYINDGRLTSVSGNGNNYTLKYDALGRTISRTLNGATTYYYYDGEKPILEQGATSASNLYGLGIDEIVIRFEPTDVKYFYQDHEGSVTHVANLSGSVTEQYRYDAFGAPTIMDAWGNVRANSAINTRFMFTGREWAPNNLGFYEYRARAYHPGLGRFMSEDPKGFAAGDYNLYRYCANDPVDRTDPMGLLSGFDQYRLAYDPNEHHDTTHDGYQVQGVPGTESKPGGVHLEVDRSVSTVSHLRSGEAGATTVHTTAKDVSGTPSIHQQIDTRYATDAGPKIQNFARNNEWTHSNDAIKAVNSYRSQVAGWASAMKMSPTATLGLLQNGNRFVPSVSHFDASFHQSNFDKWDNTRLFAPNRWIAPNGVPVAPHSPIDPESGNPLDYKE